MMQGDLFVVEPDVSLPLPWEQTAYALASFASFHADGKLNVHFPKVWGTCPKARNPGFGDRIRGFWGMELRAHMVVQSKDFSSTAELRISLPLTTTRGTWRYKDQEFIPPMPDAAMDAILADRLRRMVQNPGPKSCLVASGSRFREGDGRMGSRTKVIERMLLQCVNQTLSEFRKEKRPFIRNGLAHLHGLSRAGRLEQPIRCSPSALQLLEEALPIRDNPTPLPGWAGGPVNADHLPHASTKASHIASDMPHVNVHLDIDPSLPPGMAMASKELLDSMRSLRVPGPQTDLEKRIAYRCPKVGDPLGLLNPSGRSPSMRLVATTAESGRRLRVSPADSIPLENPSVVATYDERCFDTPISEIHPNIWSSDALSAELNRRIGPPPLPCNFEKDWTVHLNAKEPLNRAVVFQSLLGLW
ncbi:MAG: hypothetical protein VXW32_12075, partial [Myxococcota bacterium]|nr:hypothetical protein [Myxococcota bacterium]